MAGSAGPTTEQLELARAAEHVAPLRRAVKLGRSNGLGYAAFGALTIAVSLVSFDGSALLLGGCLLAVGIMQRRATTGLVAGDLAASGKLARNELLLLVAICAYALAQLTVLRADTSAELAILGESAGVDVADLVATMTNLVYGSVIVVSLLYQGGMALYFRRRGPLVDRYVREVPAWARETIAKLP